jgi:hypothetical protein
LHICSLNKNSFFYRLDHCPESAWL